jgi:hypothetical protein
MFRPLMVCREKSTNYKAKLQRYNVACHKDNYALTNIKYSYVKNVKYRAEADTHNMVSFCDGSF